MPRAYVPRVKPQCGHCCQPEGLPRQSVGFSFEKPGRNAVVVSQERTEEYNTADEKALNLGNSQ
jgi:hypothetical protein